MNMQFWRSALAILILTVFTYPSHAKNPLENLPEYWISHFDMEASSTERQARFVGYLEGSLDIKVPQWWRNEGLRRFSGVESSENASEYGSHYKASTEVNDEVILVERDKFLSTPFSVRRKGKNSDIWDVTVDEVTFGTNGNIIRDYTVLVGGETIYVLGRETDIRFIVALSMKDGKRLGYFAYSADKIQDIDIVSQRN